MNKCCVEETLMFCIAYELLLCLGGRYLAVRQSIFLSSDRSIQKPRFATTTTTKTHVETVYSGISQDINVFRTVNLVHGSRASIYNPEKSSTQWPVNTISKKKRSYGRPDHMQSVLCKNEQAIHGGRMGPGGGGLTG